MLGESVRSWTRIVARMSTASREYGFSDGFRVGPGAPSVNRVLPATVSYRNAWWMRISCQRAASESVVGPGASQRISSRTAPSTSPRNSSQLYRVSESRTRFGSWPTIPKST